MYRGTFFCHIYSVIHWWGRRWRRRLRRS